METMLLLKQMKNLRESMERLERNLEKLERRPRVLGLKLHEKRKQKKLLKSDEMNAA